MNVPIEMIDKNSKPIPPEESAVDEKEPPATTTSGNPFSHVPFGEFYDRLKWDGTLGPRPLSPAVKAKRKKLKQKRQRAQKAARKRNRR